MQIEIITSRNLMKTLSRNGIKIFNENNFNSLIITLKMYYIFSSIKYFLI